MITALTICCRPVKQHNVAVESTAHLLDGGKCAFNWNEVLICCKLYAMKSLPKLFQRKITICTFGFFFLDYPIQCDFIKMINPCGFQTKRCYTTPEKQRIVPCNLFRWLQIEIDKKSNAETELHLIFNLKAVAFHYAYTETTEDES